MAPNHFLNSYLNQYSQLIISEVFQWGHQWGDIHLFQAYSLINEKQKMSGKVCVLGNEVFYMIHIEYFITKYAVFIRHRLYPTSFVSPLNVALPWCTLLGARPTNSILIEFEIR